jgi:formyltetrahydrofolate hydrolase
VTRDLDEGPIIDQVRTHHIYHGMEYLFDAYSHVFS